MEKFSIANPNTAITLFRVSKLNIFIFKIGLTEKAIDRAAEGLIVIKPQRTQSTQRTEEKGQMICAGCRNAFSEWGLPSPG